MEAEVVCRQLDHSLPGSLYPVRTCYHRRINDQVQRATELPPVPACKTNQMGDQDVGIVRVRHGICLQYAGIHWQGGGTAGEGVGPPGMHGPAGSSTGH